jgi:hypothetical protein
MLPIAALAGQIRSRRAFAVEPPFSHVHAGKIVTLKARPRKSIMESVSNSCVVDSGEPHYNRWLGDCALPGNEPI